MNKIYFRWLILLGPISLVLAYDQNLRGIRFAELNEGDKGLVSQHMIDGSYLLLAALIGLLGYGALIFYFSSYSSSPAKSIGINVLKFIGGSISILLVLLLHSFFTGMITQ